MGEMVRDGRLDLAQLFDEDMLGDDLDAWLAESSLMKRTFRACAIIAGLIERRYPGQEKTGRQMTVSSDLIYDVLRQHEPDHILLGPRSPMRQPALSMSAGSDILETYEWANQAYWSAPSFAARRAVMLEIGRESSPVRRVRLVA